MEPIIDIRGLTKRFRGKTAVNRINLTVPQGAIFAFLISLDEVPIALFMGGGDATTLPVKIFTAIEISFGGDILAVASLVVCGSVVLMLILDRLVGLERLFATKN